MPFNSGAGPIFVDSYLTKRVLFAHPDAARVQPRLLVLCSQLYVDYSLAYFPLMKVSPSTSYNIGSKVAEPDKYRQSF